METRNPQIIILNAGGQYCHLIARRIRSSGVSAEIRDVETPAAELANYRGIIISGGPSSVYEVGSPKMDPGVLELGVPILGICYGHQLIAYGLGGIVSPGIAREYGSTKLRVLRQTGIFEGLSSDEIVWMSHSDTVTQPPPDWEVLGSTDDCAVAAMADLRRFHYATQFHPEVGHTKCGKTILENFVFRICGCEPDWDPAGRIDKLFEDIRSKARRRNVFFLISGGVDSTVAFKLCVEALGKERVLGLYVDTGFMRKDETFELAKTFADLGLDNVEIKDESLRFLKELENVYDPEEKRSKIGDLFYTIQDETLEQLRADGEEWLLGQGTIYPDTIETGHSKRAGRIKTHHNRVGLMKALLDEGRLLEPLAEFYKDEVREIGAELGLPPKVIWNRPFPGPGLAIRCLCSRDGSSVREDRELNALASNYGFWAKIASLRTVGVQGDSRTYANLVLIGGEKAPLALEEASTSITNSCESVNRVAYVVAPHVSKDANLRIIPSKLIPQRLELLRKADSIAWNFAEENSQCLPDIWQFAVILAPITLGSGESIALRPVGSKDGMTAEFSKFRLDLLDELAARILRLKGVDCVLYDVTNKPPATIEWE